MTAVLCYRSGDTILFWSSLPKPCPPDHRPSASQRRPLTTPPALLPPFLAGFGIKMRSPLASSEEDESAMAKTAAVLSVEESPEYRHRWNGCDYRKWKVIEEEILRNFEPKFASLKQYLLLKARYDDGVHLTEEDKRAVVERLLVDHWHAEEWRWIWCGLVDTMVTSDYSLIVHVARSLRH